MRRWRASGRPPVGPSTPSDLILNTPIGTLKYCAPEILKRLDTHGIQARVTTRIDIQKLDMFAAGVIVYVMLSGVWPFSSKSTQALATQIERCVLRHQYQGPSPAMKNSSVDNVSGPTLPFSGILKA
eukprot:EG_transcript_26308